MVLGFSGCGFSSDSSSTSATTSSETPSSGGSSGGNSSTSVSGRLHLDINNPSLDIGEDTTATLSMYGISSGESATVNLSSSPSGFVSLSKNSCTLSAQTSSCDFTISGISKADGSITASISGTDITTVTPVGVDSDNGVLQLSLNPIIYDGSLNPATIRLAGYSGDAVSVSLGATDTVASIAPTGFRNIQHIFFKTIDIASSFIFTNAYAADAVGAKKSKILTFLNQDTRDAIVEVELNSANDYEQTILVDGVGVGQSDIELSATGYIAPREQLETLKAVKGHIVASLASSNIKSGDSTEGTIKLEKSEGVSPFKVSISSADSNVTISNTSPSPCLLSSSSTECTFTAIGKGSAESFITIEPFGYDTINLPINVDSTKGTISLSLDKNQITVGEQATATLTLDDSSGILGGVKTTITSMDTKTVAVEDKTCYLSTESNSCEVKLFAQDIPRNGIKISAEAHGYIVTPKFIDVRPEYGAWSISPSTVKIDKPGDTKQATITLSSSAIGVSDFVPQIGTIGNAKVTLEDSCRLSSKNRSCDIDIKATSSGTDTLSISAPHYDDLKTIVTVGQSEAGYLDFNSSTMSLKTDGDSKSKEVKLSLKDVEKSTSINLTPSKTGIISLSSCEIKAPSYSCDINLTALKAGSIQLEAKASDSSIHPATMSVDVKDGTVEYGELQLSVAESMEPSKTSIATLRLVSSSNVDSITNLKVESNATSIIDNPTLPSGCDSNLTTIGNNKCSFTVASSSTSGSVNIKVTADSGSHNYSAEQNITVKEMPASRFVSVENKCSGDVFVEYTGGATNAIPCSPGSTQCTTQLVNIYGNDFKNWQCNAKHYCEPDTSNGGKCPNGMTFDDTIGGCKCTKNSDCQVFSEGSICNASGVCEYAFGQQAINKVPSNGNVVFTLDKNLKKPIVNSGNIAFLTGCDDDGTNCHQKPFMTSPSEFTMQSSGTDYYDLSYINSIGVPVSFEPVDENNESMVSKGKEYFCGINGATTSQTTTTELTDYRCEYDYATRFNSTTEGANNIAYNFVSDGGSNCTDHSDCSGSEVCGLSYATASAGGTQSTCGKRRGYWTYTALCSMPTPKTHSSDNHSSYVNTNMGVDCSSHAEYALCLQSDNSPLLSGWGYTSDQCGCSFWTDETSAPLKDLPGTSAKSDCHSASDWTTYIKPKVEVVKKGCPSAYSHQYDDPYSTFQCQNNIHGINMANYKITLCPSSKDNGMSFD